MVRARTNLGIARRFVQLQEGFFDRPHHLQRLARPATIEEKSHDCNLLAIPARFEREGLTERRTRERSRTRATGIPSEFQGLSGVD